MFSSWTLTAPMVYPNGGAPWGGAVYLTISNFQTEANFDVLQIRDGSSSSSPYVVLPSRPPPLICGASAVYTVSNAGALTQNLCGRGRCVCWGDLSLSSAPPPHPPCPYPCPSPFPLVNHPPLSITLPLPLLQAAAVRFRRPVLHHHRDLHP